MGPVYCIHLFQLSDVVNVSQSKIRLIRGKNSQGATQIEHSMVKKEG